MNNDNDVTELPAPPFNPATPTGAAKDHVRKITDVPKGRTDLSRCQFAANLFRQLATTGGTVASFAGETHPPAAEFLLGSQDAYRTAAFIMERLAADKPFYADEEKVRDISGILARIIEALFDAKLMTSIHLRGAPPLEDIMSSDTAA